MLFFGEGFFVFLNKIIRKGAFLFVLNLTQRVEFRDTHKLTLIMQFHHFAL